MIAPRYGFILPALTVLALLTSSGRGAAQVRFEVRGESGVAGEAIAAGLNQDVKAALFIRNSGGAAIQGFQMAITYDPTFLDFTGGTWRGTALETQALNNNGGPSSFAPREVPGGNVTLGVVFQGAVAPTFTLGAGTFSVGILTFRAIKLTAEGTPTRIVFSELPVGTPPVGNGYVDVSPEIGFVAVSDTGGVDVNVGAEQAYGIAFKEAQGNVDSGAEVTVPIVLFNGPSAVHGFSFGVRHDPAQLDLVDVTFSDALKAVLGSTTDDLKFQAINKSPAGGGGFTAAVVLSAREATRVLDAAGSPHEVVNAKYRAKAPSGNANLTIAGDLGSPKVEVILDLFGVAQRPQPPSTNPLPTQLTLAIKSTALPSFIRGDLDQNHRISLTDVVGIVQYLFDNGSLLPVFNPTVANCLIAFNVNGDSDTGQVETEDNINVTDVTYMLEYQFRAGPPPPAPFGTSCAPFSGTASPRMTCTQFACQ